MPLTESDLEGLVEQGVAAASAAEAIALRARQLISAFQFQEDSGEPLTNAQKGAHIPFFVDKITDLDAANTAMQTIQSTQKYEERIFL